MDNMWMLAVKSVPTESTESQETTTTTTTVAEDPNTGAPTGKPQGFGMQQLVLFGLMFVIMYFILFRGPKKRQRQQQQMVSSLKKNDRVRTIGGIFGTVVDVQGDEVTLKVDESNNTKIKILASAVGKNLSSENA